MQNLYNLLRKKEYQQAKALLLSNSLSKEEITYTNKSGCCPLYFAIKAGDTELVNLLLKQGANPNQTIKPRNESMLMLACNYNDNDDIVNALLKYGAITDAVTTDGISAILIATSRIKIDIVRRLLQHKANPNIPEYKNKFTALHIAIECKQDAIVSLLLEAAANPHHINGYYETTLKVALDANNLQLAKRLINEYGCILVKTQLTSNSYNNELSIAARCAINQLACHIINDDYNAFIKQISNMSDQHEKDQATSILFQAFMGCEQESIKKFQLKLAERISPIINRKMITEMGIIPTEASQQIQLIHFYEREWNKFIETYKQTPENPLSNNNDLETALKEVNQFIKTPTRWMPLLKEIEKQFSEALKANSLETELVLYDKDQYFFSGGQIIPNITEDDLSEFDKKNNLSKQVNHVCIELLNKIVKRHGFNHDENMQKLLSQHSKQDSVKADPILVLSDYAKHDHLKTLMCNFNILFREAKSGAGIAMHDSLIHLLQIAILCLAVETKQLSLPDNISLIKVIHTMLAGDGGLWNHILDIYKKIAYKSEDLTAYNFYLNQQNASLPGITLAWKTNHYACHPYSIGDYLRSHNEFDNLRKLYLLNAIVPAIKLSKKAAKNRDIQADPNTVLSMFAMSGSGLSYPGFILGNITSDKLIPTLYPGILFKKKKELPTTNQSTVSKDENLNILKQV